MFEHSKRFVYPSPYVAAPRPAMQSVTPAVAVAPCAGGNITQIYAIAHQQAQAMVEHRRFESLMQRIMQ